MDRSPLVPPLPPASPTWTASEEDVYAEHRAALEATLFSGTGLPEVVLVLEGGRLQVPSTGRSDRAAPGAARHSR